MRPPADAPSAGAAAKGTGPGRRCVRAPARVLSPQSGPPVEPSGEAEVTLRRSPRPWLLGRTLIFEEGLAAFSPSCATLGELGRPGREGPADHNRGAERALDRECAVKPSWCFSSCWSDWRWRHASCFHLGAAGGTAVSDAGAPGNVGGGCVDARASRWNPRSPSRGLLRRRQPHPGPSRLAHPDRGVEGPIAGMAPDRKIREKRPPSADSRELPRLEGLKMSGEATRG